jgi:hypothetical protein
MEDLSKIEKNIINYLVNSDKYSDDSITDISEIEFTQYSSSNIETLIYSLFENDESLKNVGIKISYNKSDKEFQIHIMEPKKTSENDSEIIWKGNWILFTKINYLIVRITNFLNQLENNGYVDSVEIRNSIKKKSKRLMPFEIHCKDDYEETLKISNSETVTTLLECFKNIYVPNNKLRSFYKNGFKSLTMTIAEKDIQLAKQNNKIAKFALYIAVFSALGSLIATIITLYSIGIPATFKIDENQVEKIIEKIEPIENKTIQIDSLKNEQ